MNELTNTSTRILSFPNGLTVTSTSILSIDNGIGGCVALAQITFNGSLEVTGIKMIDNGVRSVKYPRNPNNKKRKAYFFPKDKGMRDALDARLWEDYDAMIEW